MRVFMTLQAFCQFLSQPLHGQALVGAIANGVKMYFNHTGQIKCLNLSQEAAGGLGDMGWSYQVHRTFFLTVKYVYWLYSLY